MIKSIVKKLAKKYVLSAIEEACEAKKERVAYYAGLVGMWILRLEKAISLLKGLALKMDDGVLTADEADTVIEEAETLVKEW